ncbi:MAG: hypothetical protein NTY34_01605 [Candidatus Omnitrophica bacterium]|nr:hypothetical protein [Candidatus Omnitrophota bacterium]
MGVKYKVNENFFKTWSRSSSYVLGLLFADGILRFDLYIPLTLALSPKGERGFPHNFLSPFRGRGLR